jgi:uncharacterized surface protein with fasciclin (FAS1) repeats
MTLTAKANAFLAALALAFVAARHAPVDAFVAPSPSKVAIARRIIPPSTLRESPDDGPKEDGATTPTIQSYLQQNYPLFESLLLVKIPNIYDTLRTSDSSNGFTIFCPSNSVMENIDPKRRVQIVDPRNDEVTEKLASYHVISNGKVTQERLKREDWTVPRSADGVAALSIGGVLTLAGELRVGRSKSGGFLGFGAKEDGGVVIGNNEARVVKSTTVGNGVVHEVDGFVAPDLIWR